MRKQLLLLLFSLFAVVGYARTVTGVVTSEADKLPVIGATVMVEGTNTGTATDFDGKYTINAGDNDVLVFSYVGMETANVKVNGRDVINVELKENSQVLDEVVVTAMGQTQEKKKLNFAVQSLDSDDVTAGQTANFANSLQGKVAGLQVSQGGSSPNASTQLIIRAISSINTAQSNEPLVIIDGMPVRGAGTSLGDLNANDIENMSVLKGAAASALYGQEAANGVIMITTKKGKAGQLEVKASGSWEFSNALRTPAIQDQFIGGSQGFYKENSVGGWGPYLTSTDRVYDNVGDFLGTGFLQKYDLSISGGSEKFNAYASASYMKNDGIVPEDYKDRLNIFVKGEFKPSEQVTIQLSSSFINSKSRGFGNSMSTIYSWPINKNMADYVTTEGRPNWSNRYDNWDALTDEEKIGATVSPYFGRYMDKSETNSTRMIINGQISYEPIKNLVFTGKLGYDKGFSNYESYSVSRFVNSDFKDPESSALADYQYKFGAYSFQPSNSSQFTAQLLGTYNITFAEDYTLNILAGAEYKENNSLSAQMAGQRFMLEGDFYSFMNIDPESFTTSTGTDYNMTMSHTRKNKFGYFGELRFDYKGMAQVSATARYDGSSTLRQVDCTYFYPSVTAGLIFSELFKIQNDWFSYGKLRGNWAKVGKDAPLYRFSESFKNWEVFPDGGWGVNPVNAVAKFLEPEMTSSWEVGADLRFFDSRTRLDVAWYSTTVDNQIVQVRVSPSSGTIVQTRNEGSIENKGLELTLAQDILRMKDFDWTVTANFSFNRGKVRSLPDQLTEIQGTQYGDVFPTAYLHGSTTALSGKDYERTPDGQIICDENGYPIISAAKGILIGNREPDFLLGLGSSFRWKDLTVSFLFDGRCGGDVYNYTRRGLNSSGMESLLTKYRNHEILIKGVVAQGDSYVPNTTPVILDSNFINNYYNVVSSNFIEDGSYIRLSYVTVGYDFSKFLKKGCPIKGLKLSATGRNLFLLSKYTGSDPQILAGTGGGTGSAGIDYYSVPSTRSFNFSLSATF